jgi:hypothetical protein
VDKSTQQQATIGDHYLGECLFLGASNLWLIAPGMTIEFMSTGRYVWPRGRAASSATSLAWPLRGLAVLPL